MTIGDRATKDEVAARTELVLRLILQGYRSPAIVQQVSKTWSISQRDAYRYILKARKELELTRQNRMTHILAEHLEVRRDLRREAYNTGNHYLALQCARDEAQLLGLYPKHESIADLDAAIASLLQLAASRKGEADRSDVEGTENGELELSNGISNSSDGGEAVSGSGDDGTNGNGA